MKEEKNIFLKTLKIVANDLYDKNSLTILTWQFANNLQKVSLKFIEVMKMKKVKVQK